MVDKVKVSLKDVNKAGSCNYCDKGELSVGNTLNYPYTEVIVVRGNHIETRFCKECFEKLTKYNDYL